MFHNSSSSPAPLSENMSDDGVSGRKNNPEDGTRANKGGILDAMNRPRMGIRSRGSDVTKMNQTVREIGWKEGGDSTKNHTSNGGNGISTNDQGKDGVGSGKGSVLPAKKQAGSGVPPMKEPTSGVGPPKAGGDSTAPNPTKIGVGSLNDTVLATANETTTRDAAGPSGDLPVENQTGRGVARKGQRVDGAGEGDAAKNRFSSGLASTRNRSRTVRPKVEKKGVSSSAEAEWISTMKGCDIFQGRWVKDDFYPLYPEGTCPHIDEPFDCYHNGRPDRSYQKLRWQPNDCQIPR